MHKNLIGAKPVDILFNKIDGFIRDYDGTKYLALFSLEKYDGIYDRIRYLIGLKVVLHLFFSYNHAKTKIDSDDDWPLEELLTLHNVIILIKSVFNKDQNHCCYNIVLQECSYQLVKK